MIWDGKMSGKWFTNRGQIIQVAIAVVALGVATVVALPALAQHPNLLTWLPVILIPAIALGAFSYGKNYAAPTPSPPTPPDKATASPASVQTVANAILQRQAEEVFVTEVNIYTPTLKMGDFWNDDARRVRVAAVSILDEPEPKVELAFGSGGLFHGGTQTKRTKTNQYLMKRADSAFQAEEFCVTAFSFDEKHVWFFAARVDHINIYAKEVVLSICKVSSFKRQRF
jgi:hypothetical protein